MSLSACLLPSHTLIFLRRIKMHFTGYSGPTLFFSAEIQHWTVQLVARYFSFSFSWTFHTSTHRSVCRDHPWIS